MKHQDWTKLSIEHKRVIYDAVRYYQDSRLTSHQGECYNRCDEILSSLGGTLKRYEVATKTDCDI